MKKIKLHDKTFRTYIESSVIDKAIAEMVEKMKRDLKDERPVFVGILNGAFMFVADVLKDIEIPESEIYFMKISSYDGLNSTGEIKEQLPLTVDITHRTVVILEDMVDTGRSMNFLINHLKKQGAGKVCVAAMFYKPQALVEPVQVDYYAMTLDNGFVVGRGLDYNELGRNLRDLYILDKE